MINLYFDLDDVVFDFSRDFINFVNESYGREQYKISNEPALFNPEEVFGMDEKTLRYLLNYYIEAGKFAIQPLMPGAFDALNYFVEHPYFPCNIPNFITVRDPQSIIHTITRLQDVYHDLGYVYPLRGFQLFSANSKYHKKWHLIKELSRFNSQGIFVDDHPDYINDVLKHCPGVITIWMNSLNIKNGAHPHYEVKGWKEIIKLLETNIYEDLLAKSNHPGVQTEII